MSENISYTARSYMDWHADWGYTEVIKVGKGTYYSFMTRFAFVPQRALRQVTVHLETTRYDASFEHLPQAPMYAAVVTGSAVSEPTAQTLWHWVVRNGRLCGEITIDRQLNAGTTYYLWLWGDWAPGGYQANGYNNSAAENVLTTITGESAGQCYIAEGGSFAAYLAYIDDGTAFRAYIPYRDTGTAWEVLT